MKFTKYIAAGMIALAGLTSCNDSFLETDYTQYLDEEAAAEAAGKNPDVFLNGMWSWMVTFDQTNNSAHDDFGFMGSLHATDMMAEDIVMASSHWFNYDHQLDNHQEPYRRTLCHWLNFYTMIAKSNEIISLYPHDTTPASHYFPATRAFKHPNSGFSAKNRYITGSSGNFTKIFLRKINIFNVHTPTSKTNYQAIYEFYQLLSKKSTKIFL